MKIFKIMPDWPWWWQDEMARLPYSDAGSFN